MCPFKKPGETYYIPLSQTSVIPFTSLPTNPWARVPFKSQTCSCHSMGITNFLCLIRKTHRRVSLFLVLRSSVPFPNCSSLTECPEASHPCGPPLRALGGRALSCKHGHAPPTGCVAAAKGQLLAFAARHSEALTPGSVPFYDCSY